MSLNIQPTEPGYYFATWHAPNNEIARRYLVELRGESDGSLCAHITGEEDELPLDQFSNWEGPIVDPRQPKLKKRAAVVAFSFESVGLCMNLPEGVEIEAMQVDFSSQSLRCKLVGPGLTVAHELGGFEAEQLKEAPVLSKVVEIDGRLVHMIERVGLGT